MKVDERPPNGGLFKCRGDIFKCKSDYEAVE